MISIRLVVEALNLTDILGREGPIEIMVDAFVEEMYRGVGHRELDPPG